MERYKNRNWLFNQYITQNKSSIEISQECGRSKQIILKWLKRFNIPRREVHEVQRKHIRLTPELKKTLEGLVLGDGNLFQKNSGGGTLYQHADSFRDFTLQLSNYLKELGLPTTDRGVIKKGTNWLFTTVTVMELNEMNEEWYYGGGGIKTLPDQFSLNPTNLFWWYIGDGYLSNQENILFRIRTLKNFIPTLKEELERIGFQIRNGSKIENEYISLRTKETEKFLEYCLDQNFVPEDYEYKFEPVL